MSAIGELRRKVRELEQKISELESAQKPAPIKWKKTYSSPSTNCPECGLPYGQCDPEGIGHYRG